MEAKDFFGFEISSYDSVDFGDFAISEVMTILDDDDAHLIGEQCLWSLPDLCRCGPSLVKSLERS